MSTVIRSVNRGLQPKNGLRTNGMTSCEITLICCEQRTDESNSATKSDKSCVDDDHSTIEIDRRTARDALNSPNCSRIPSIDGHLTVPTERHKCVKLQVEPECFGDYSVQAVNNDTHYSIEFRPLATLLRFRVVQIVCGIITILLGVVAVFEPGTRTTLGLGIPVGIFTAFSSVSRIRETQRQLARRLTLTFPLTPLSNLQELGESTLTLKLAPLYPFTSTFLCLLASVLLLCLSTAAVSSVNHNTFALGILLGLCSLIVLSVEFIVLIYSWHCIDKYQCNNISLNNHQIALNDGLCEANE